MIWRDADESRAHSAVVAAVLAVAIRPRWMHCPISSAETHHMIGAATLDKMKDSAYLINAVRGPVVDPKALYQARQEQTRNRHCRKIPC